MTAAYLSRLLGGNDDCTGFLCGNGLLDRWFHTEAKRAHLAGVCTVTVWVAKATGTIAAFYAISPTQASRMADHLPRSLHGGYSTVPGYRIGRLAVDKDHQGQGVGTQLLYDALLTVVTAAEAVGGRVIVIDPIDQRAAAWYDSLGFVATMPDTDRPAPRYITVADVVRTINEHDPHRV